MRPLHRRPLSEIWTLRERFLIFRGAAVHLLKLTDFSVSSPWGAGPVFVCYSVFVSRHDHALVSAQEGRHSYEA